MDVMTTPGHLIGIAARGFARLSEARLGPLGFGVGHLPVLVALRDGQAMTQRDLASFAGIGQPPMAQMLARMERDGLITRKSDPSDRRSSHVALTASALERLPEAIAVLLHGNREVLRDFTSDERETLTRLLAKLIAGLGQPSATNDSTKCPSSKRAVSRDPCAPTGASRT